MVENTAPSWCQAQPWSAVGQNMPCQQKLFSGATDDPRSNCSACTSGQRNGEKPRVFPAGILCCSLRENGLCKLASNCETQKLSLCWDAGSGLCLPWDISSLFGTSGCIIGTLNTLISAGLLGLLKHNARAYFSLEVTVCSREVSGS